MKKKLVSRILECLLLCMSFTCGARVSKGWRTFLGRDVDISEVPFIVRLVTSDWGTCTGFIVAEDWIVTAAHCFESSQAAIVTMGSSSKFNSSIKIFSDEVIVHPEYYPGYRQYDIALIRLAQKIKENEVTKIINTEDKEWPRFVYNRACFVAGFGFHLFTEKDGILHGGEVHAGTGPYPYTCQFTYYENIIWTYRNISESLCYGDSGCPLICDNVAVGVGATSFTCGPQNYDINCGESFVDGYVSLYKLLPWLKSHISCLPTSCKSGAPRNMDYLLIMLITTIQTFSYI
ncbi:trypsin 3A1-like [Rhodnius prolixus]|uniref:trypsin 3A1-like n=1 Tax=Rhodnius prolixus TaxID=13249 RepID=UPI003D18E62A